jgi:hypothetical protein
LPKPGKIIHLFFDFLKDDMKPAQKNQPDRSAWFIYIIPKSVTL